MSESAERGLAEIPKAWWPGLVRLKELGKIPVDKQYNSIAAGRWAHGAPEDLPGRVIRWVESGGNVGLVPPPGVVIIDCDNAEAIEWVEQYAHPETPWTVRTESSAHAYFSYELPMGVEWLSKGVQLESGAKFDLRVPGRSQAAVPPSKHESGVHPYWWHPLPSDPALVPPMPEEMMQEMIEAGLVPEGKMVEPPDGANAHDTVRTWIMQRVDSVDSVEELYVLAERFAEYYVGPMRPERFEKMRGSRELRDLVEGAWERRGRNDLPRISSLGHGDDKFVNAWRTYFDEKWIHVGEWSPQGVWVQWDGESWKHRPELGDDGFHGAVQRFSATLKRLRDTDDPRLIDSETFCDMIDGMRTELSRTRTAAGPIKRLTQSFSVAGDHFDQNPHLWGCPATEKIEPKTIDFLETKVLEPDPDHLITQLGGAPYIRGRRSEVWESFVAEAFPDVSVRRYVQACAGYSMLGDPREDVVLFLIGRGGSGKSTFIGTLEKLFGDYTGFVPAVEIDDKLPGAGAGGTNASLLALRGKRIATCTELSDRVRLGAKLKALSGGDKQSGRALYSRTVTSFDPRFVIWLGGNFQPEAKAVDSGLTRRMRYIPMEVRPKKRDPMLKAKLTRPEELAGVLSWCLDGLQMYLTDGGLIAPKAVQDRSLRARKEASDIGPWLHDRVVEDEGSEGFLPSEGHDAYIEWFIQTHGTRRGLPVRTAARFAEEMAALGHESERTRHGKRTVRRFKGLRILSASELLDRVDR